MTSVVASRKAVVTHAMWETPPSSPTIVGIDVDTIVWSRAAMSMPASSALKMMLIRRRVRTIGGAERSGGGPCTEVLFRSFGGAAGARRRGGGGPCTEVLFRSFGGAAGARHGGGSGRRRPLGGVSDGGRAARRRARPTPRRRGRAGTR